MCISSIYSNLQGDVLVVNNWLFISDVCVGRVSPKEISGAFFSCDRCLSGGISENTAHLSLSRFL